MMEDSLVLLDVDLDGATAFAAVANAVIWVPMILATLPVATRAIDGHSLGNGFAHTLTTMEKSDLLSPTGVFQ